MNQERLLKVLLAPHLSEKSSLIADSNNQYVFRVLRDATKPEIKAAVEQLFTVNVDAIRVSTVKGKSKRVGQRIGQRSDWKKAYVTLKEGQEISFMSGA
ncbi:MAG: 50S ribosomal protein L23 [Thiohalomonadaceae bacterium]|jgi:large subunit ribosomal protein L23